MPPPPPPLVIRLGALGDMVMLTPALRALARRRGAPCDVVTTPRAASDVLRGLPFVGRVVPLRSLSTPYWIERGQRRLVAWLRTRAAGDVWVLESAPKIDWLLERGGGEASRRVSARDLPRGDLEHAVAYALRLVAREPPAGTAARRGAAELDGESASAPRLDHPDAWPDLALQEPEHSACRQWLERRGLADRPLVLFQTLSRNTKRGRWPPERWLAAIRHVLETRSDASVLLLGSAPERPRVKALATACNDPRVVDVAGELGVRQLAAVCAVAHSCVSLDTGPAHVAAAMGCPLVVLAGRADPRRNRPLGPGPTRVVTAWPAGDWPASRAEWEASHRVGEVAVEPVLAAWREVALESAAAPASDRLQS